MELISVVLYIVCGIVNTWIGVIQLLDVPLVVSYLFGIRGLWRKLKSAWQEFTVAWSFRNVKDGLFWAFACVYGGLILIVIEGIYGKNLLACLVVDHVVVHWGKFQRHSIY